MRGVVCACNFRRVLVLSRKDSKMNKNNAPMIQMVGFFACGFLGSRFSLGGPGLKMDFENDQNRLASKPEPVGIKIPVWLVLKSDPARTSRSVRHFGFFSHCVYLFTRSGVLASGLIQFSTKRRGALSSIYCEK